MIGILREMFSYTFLVRAVVVGALVSLCAALLGVSLVLKRYSMIGDGLSHVGFGALAIATALNAAPLAVSVPVVVLAAFLLLRISENSSIKGDAAIALISTGALAIGVIVISMTTGMNTDVCNYMFGSILAMKKSDVTLSVILAVIVLGLFVLFYNKIFAVTFDENFTRATGVKTGAYNMLLAALTAVTIVLGMRMMGALLISSLVIFPALTSMRVCKRFLTVTICSAVVSLGCFMSGVTISYVYSTPTGASVVLVNMVVFAVFWIAGKVHWKRLLAKIGKGKMVLSALLLCCLLGGCGTVSSGRIAGTGGEGASEETASEEIASEEIASEEMSADGEPDTDSAANFVPNPENEIKETAPAHGELQEEDRARLESQDTVEITEKMFVAQTNDIYYNAVDYLGKTISYEGIFGYYDDPEAGQRFYSVIRYGPGCCGIDANAGFEVRWDDSVESPEYPEQNDWVKVVGVLEEYEDMGRKFLRLRLISLTVLEERGAEFVS